ncbi:MAG: hypothetical protein EP344_04835 [Bacteroidetes bacterium]|nr:MAG: hypothetical protein EP344_04835 [Bacteroidota bacterium]
MKLGLLALAGTLLLFVPGTLLSQHSNPGTASRLVEICDNQLDDDNDGYIDCYDPDCGCFISAACTAPPDTGAVAAKLAWQSATDAVSVVATPVLANMNPQTDSIPEIIIAEAAEPDGIPNRLLFFKGDGANAAAPYVLTVPFGFDNYPVPSPTVADIDRDGIPELLIICNDRNIRVYKNYTESPTDPMELWVTSSTPVEFPDQKPYLADFDADGIPEVYSGNEIFEFKLADTANPQLISVLKGNLTRGQCFYRNFVEGATSPVAVDLLTRNNCLGDPDCNGIELGAGPTIYSVDMTTDDNEGNQIKVKRDLNQLDPWNTYADGYTAAADVNLDGVLDLVVTSKRNDDEYGVYVWNKYGLLRFFPYPMDGSEWSGGLACIANVFDDRTEGFLEDFPEIIVAYRDHLVCFNIQASIQNPTTPYWWIEEVVDFSGFTSCTAFDLNGDGVQELIYRDENVLRILYGGAAPFPPGVDANRNWMTLVCGSLTGDEYPVLGDADNDGTTEIIVPGYTFSGYNTPQTDHRGRLQVYKSGDAPWLPGRNIWNQFAYFIVNVNDDLTIPLQQQAHQIEFPAPGSGNYPLNQFLGQAPLFNDNFEPYQPVPDATLEVKAATCAQDSIELEVEICNAGSQTLPAGIPLAVYSSDPTASNATVVGVPVTPQAIPVGACLTFVFHIPKASGGLFAVINDTGTLPTPYNLQTAFPATGIPECAYENNLDSFTYEVPTQPFTLGSDISICSDTVFTLSPGPGYASYSWQDGSTDSTFQVTGYGLYWVEVEDVCSGLQQDSVFVDTSGVPQITLSAVDGDCAGTPAAAGVTGFNAVTPLAFQWSNGDTTAWISGLVSGTYQVLATDANGCSTVGSVSVNAVDQLVVSTATTEIACAGGTGSITLNVVSGAAPFTYIWQDSSSSETLSDALAGTYLVTVTDANGCSQKLAPELAEPLPLEYSVILSTSSCVDTPNGSISISGVSNGTPPYIYIWSNDSTGLQLNGTGPGIYTVTITDSKGCTLEVSETVDAFAVPELEFEVEQISCSGEDDGSIAVSVLNGVPDVSFFWSTGDTVQLLQGLGPDSLFLEIMYGNDLCALPVVGFLPEEPAALVLTGTGINPSCHNTLDGQIDLEVGGGTAPYSYYWSNGAVTEDLDTLSFGFYQVTLTDANGCTAKWASTLDNPPALIPAAFDTLASCPGDSTGHVIFQGMIQGQPPFQLQWSTGDLTDSLLNVPAGTYGFTVTDNTGCSIESSVDVPEFPGLDIIETVGMISCYEEHDGHIEVIEQSGISGVSYTWSTGDTMPVLGQLAPGQYMLTITYGGICPEFRSFTLTEPDPIQVTAAQISPARCFGEASGSIDLAVQGGTSPYMFSWPNGADTNLLQDAAAGIIPVKITDANGCMLTDSFTVGQPEPLVVQETVVADTCGQGGAVTVAVSGGNMPYAYLWSNNDTAPDIYDLPPGVYTVMVTDEQGCTSSLSVLVESVGMVPDVTSFTNTITCAAPLVEIGVLGGAPGYHYIWNGPAGALPDQAIQAVTTAGGYDVTVTDGQNCEVSLQITVMADTALPALNTDPADTGWLPCDGTSLPLQGNFASAGSMPETKWQRLENGVVTQTVDGDLIMVDEPGTYVYSVLNLANGCLSLDTVEVLAAGEMQANVQVDQVTCPGLSDGTIVLQYLSGGTAPFQYSIDNGASYSQDPVFAGLVPGVYQVKITDAQGCEWTETIQMEEPLSFSVTLLADQTVVAPGTQVLLTAILDPPGFIPASVRWTPDTLFIPGNMDLAQPVIIQDPVVLGLVVEDVNGCSANDELAIQVEDNIELYIPNAFKPESKENGVFTIFAGPAVERILELAVFDRWGDLIFLGTDLLPNDETVGWDGTYKGELLPPNVFVWYARLQISGVGEVVKKGNVQLIR